MLSTDVPSQPPVVAERLRPWRLQSQGYVAVLSGVAAVTVIALMNATRLDVGAEYSLPAPVFSD
ncbi:hypothetical protein GCM10009525_51790 [Streptosporangium amethystogenes subsp. fukuiense]